MYLLNKFENMIDKQKEIYHSLNPLDSQTPPTKGRLGAIPVVLLDVTISTVKYPLLAIAKACAFLMHLIECFQSKPRRLRLAINDAEETLMNIAATPIALALSPIKLIYQLFATLINPKNAQSIDKRECESTPSNSQNPPPNLSIKGPLDGIRVVLLDVSGDSLRYPVKALLTAVLVFLKVVYIPIFTFRIDLKSVIQFSEEALTYAVATPISLAMAPIKLIYQLSLVLLNPQNILPISYYK